MKKNILYILFLSLIFLYSCDVLDSNNENNLSDIEIKVNNMPKLADTLNYVGWLQHIDFENNKLVSKKVLVINTDNDGNFSKRMHFDFGDLHNNYIFAVTIEKKNTSNDSLPNLNNTVLSGNFFGNSTTLSVGAEVNNFSAAGGVYNLVTPTDGPNTNEKSGVWFVDSVSRAAGPLPGLTLPVLNPGLIYQGWVEINGQFVSTGKFNDPTQPDLASEYSGSGVRYNFPGEDFLINAPNGLTFPTDLSGSKVFVSFGLRSGSADISKPSTTILQADIPGNAQSGVSYRLSKLDTPIPSGSVNDVIDVVR